MSKSRDLADLLADGAITADELDIGQIGGSRNKIINGSMRIAQRGTSAITGNGYAVDRFNGTKFATDELAWSLQQDSSAPTGFVNSTKVTITTAEASLTTNENVVFNQSIEGTNISDLAWGTASAKTITLSFWVRSSLTGTFGGALYNSAADRFYPFSYSIAVADTWEQKTITIAGDTSGTWLTTTGVGIIVQWGLGQGPDRLGTAGAWTSSNNQGVTGQVQLAENLNATWQITGVQLEVGTVATPFEHRSYGEELALCQRYYYQNGNGTQDAIGIRADGFNSGLFELTFSGSPVVMRTLPTVTTVAGSVLDATNINWFAKNGCSGTILQQTVTFGSAANKYSYIHKYTMDAEL